jgi:putative pyoverdin transport system ATP-binding/permease protein
MEINFKQLLSMLRFLWSNGPPRLKLVLLPLALVAGFSRDYVMIVVNKSAAAPLDEAMSLWLPLFVVAFFVVIGSSYFYQVLTTVVTTYVVNTVRLQLIRNLLKVQPNFIDRQQHGSIYHILTTDVSTVANFTSTILGLLPSVFFLCIAIPQLFYYSAIAGVFALLVMVGGTLSYHLQQKAMSSLNADARAMDVAYFERVSDLLKGFRELRLNLHRGSSFSTDIANVLSKLRQMLIQVNRIYESGESAVHALKFLLFAGIVFLVPFLAKTDVAITFQVLTLVLFSLTPFEQIIASYPSIIGTLVSYVRIADLNSQLEPFERVTEVVSDRPPGFGTIALKSASAVHGSREASGFVLGPINIEIRHGEIVFLIGNNGSGKTTFMNVIAGLLDLTEGCIEVDGAVLKPEDMAAYRSRISAIFAQFHVFRQLYGLENVDAVKASTAFEKVGLKGITGIDNAAITRLDLSAGQRRRLALAIVLLEDRDVLILDEFVADQDPGQREYFFKTLLPELKSQGKTIIVSTHDMQWIEYCDRLYRFDNGKIAEVTVTGKDRLHSY